jgi:AcrR family transcriptional regulator
MRYDEAIVPVDSERNSWSTLLASIVEEPASEATERKQDRSRRREQEIHRAAIRVFAREGIARARIADMAAEAGIPISSIYEYYPSKEELAYAIPAAQLRKFFVEFGQHATDLKSARELLSAYLRMSIDFARRNPEWARILYLEVWPSVIVKESRVRKGIDDFARVVVHLIREGEQTGEWGAGPNHFETAAILIGSANQLIITWLLYRRPRDIMKAADSMIKRVMSLLGPPGGDQTAIADARSNGSAGDAEPSIGGRGRRPKTGDRIPRRS